MTSRSRLIALCLGVALASCALFALSLKLPKQAVPYVAPMDLMVFYCAARILPADPYLTEPLRSCEHEVIEQATGTALLANRVFPAPLPPFTLAALRPIGLLPFPIARALWTTLIALTSLAAIASLARLTTMRPLYVGLAVLVSTTIPSFANGQLPAIAFAACCAAALALQEKRWVPASVLCALTLLEPHLGLPICLIVGLLAPKCRLPLLACMVALGVLSLSLGLERNIEYVAHVLPAQARSELADFPGQYSLSTVLIQFGASQRTALLLGQISYLAMIGLATWVARRQIGNLGLAAAVAVPAAFALLGGTYIHLCDFGMAIPLALLLFRVYPFAMSLSLLALVAVGPLWQWIGFVPHAVAPRAVVEEALRAANGNGRPQLSEVLWAADERVRQNYWTQSDAFVRELWFYKMPTWIGLLALVFYAARPALVSKTSSRRREPKLARVAR